MSKKYYDDGKICHTNPDPTSKCPALRAISKEEAETGINMDELLRTMKELKVEEPIDLYQATVVPYSFYNQIRKDAVESSIIGGLFGIQVLPLAGMPEDEGLMFKDKADAYRFVEMAEDHGYEYAKKNSNLLIYLKNLK